MFEESQDRIPQLEAMRLGVEYKQMMKIRGFEIQVRPLTVYELAQVAASTQRQFRGLPVDAQNAITETIILAKETLKVASTSEPGATDYQLTDLMLDRATTDELQYMHKQYLAICDKVNPMLEEMAPEKVAELVEALKKNSSQLTELSFMELANVCRNLLKRD